jgi:hypothetical protein
LNFLINPEREEESRKPQNISTMRIPGGCAEMVAAEAELQKGDDEDEDGIQYFGRESRDPPLLS